MDFPSCENIIVGRGAEQLPCVTFGTMTLYENKKLATMARRHNQRRIYLAVATRTQTWRILERGSKGELLLVNPWNWCVLYWGVGAGMALALLVETYQGNSHEDHVPDHNHWLYGK